MIYIIFPNRSDRHIIIFSVILQYVCGGGNMLYFVD